MRLAYLRPAIRAAELRHVRPPDDRLNKKADPYYATPEHRAWRIEVIKRAGGRCQWPGCGRREPRMFADHIVERRDDRSRELDPANGQCLCSSCHVKKTVQEKKKRLMRHGGGV